MRLLLTTDTVGGVWTFTRELTRCLLAEGHAVALVSFGAPPRPHQRLWCERMAAAAGDRFLYIASDEPLEWMQANHLACTEGADLLLRLADRFRADLLHANQFCWGTLSSSLPCLITAHSDVLSWASACKPEALQPSPWLRRYTELVQAGLDGADALAAPTDWMGTEFARHFDVGIPRRTVANGRTLTPPSRPRHLQAVSAGRLWDEAKGLRTLAGMQTAMPLLLAGDRCFDGAEIDGGPAQLTGPLEEADLLALFASCSVYIASSLYEPFGLAALEAAQCGCAVVARDLPSLHEVWSEGALFFDSPAALASRLRTLAHDPRALLKARRRSLARAQRYTAERMTAGYLDLYGELLGYSDLVGVQAHRRTDAA